MSASTLRASIDSKTDLPTPEPAKMPSRWPRQQVRKVLSARTPRSSGRPTRLRECAGGGVLRNGIGDGPCDNGPLPSIGSPIALRTRPSQAACGRTWLAALAITARQPRLTPSSPALVVELERDRVQKTGLTQYLRAIR